MLTSKLRNRKIEISSETEANLNAIVTIDKIFIGRRCSIIDTLSAITLKYKKEKWPKIP